MLYRRAWCALHGAGLTSDQRALLWRILHGVLRVGAFGCYVAPSLPLEAAYCTAPCCDGRRVVETLSHAFVACPAARPALEWLCDLWQAISPGNRPPMDAQVLLAGDYRVWRPRAPEGDSDILWMRLRASVLQGIWRVRCRRTLYVDGAAPAPALAAAAVMLAIEEIVSALQRDWLRVERGAGIVTESGLPVSWFRGRHLPLEEDAFKKIWAIGGVLCSVLPGGPAAEGAPASGRLHLRLHPGWRVVPVPGL